MSIGVMQNLSVSFRKPGHKWRHIDDVGRTTDLHEKRPCQCWPRQWFRAVAVCGNVGTAVRGGVGGRCVSIRAMWKRSVSWRNQDISGVMLTTLVAQPIYTNIGRVRAGPGSGSGLSQWVGVSERQCEVAWEDHVCLSERCSSFQTVGATRT